MFHVSPPTSHLSLFTFHFSPSPSPVSFSITHLSFWIGLARAARRELARDHRRVCSYPIEVMDDFSLGRQPAPLRHRCCHIGRYLAAKDDLNRSGFCSHSTLDDVGPEEQDAGETEKAGLNQGGADPPQAKRTTMTRIILVTNTHKGDNHGDHQWNTI